MIGDLPTSIIISGKEYAIRYGFKDCLNIMAAFEDDELTNEEKLFVMLDVLYEEPDFTDENVEEAIEKAIQFLLAGRPQQKEEDNAKPLSRLEKDEQLIFAAVNEVAHMDIRMDPNIHYWTYLSYIQSINSKSMFSSVVHIRDKLNKGQALDKEEKKFYKDNKEMIDLREPTEEDKEFANFINSIT